MKISNSNDRNKPRSLLIQTCTANCPELPFGILSPCFAVILILNIIFPDTNITEKLSVIPEEMILPSFLKYIRQLVE